MCDASTPYLALIVTLVLLFIRRSRRGDILMICTYMDSLRYLHRHSIHVSSASTCWPAEWRKVPPALAGVE